MSREKLLGQARADLVALPDLTDELARLVADRTNHDVTGYAGKIAGSPAPLSIPVVHLVDQRHKPGWHGEDPRLADLGDRYGIAPTLETWVRVIWEEMPEIPDLTEIATVRSECSTLVEHWDWIVDQPWAVEFHEGSQPTGLAADVIRLTNQVRAHLGIKPEPTYACPQCHNPAYLQPGGILACTEVGDHHIVVRDLEQQQRRRPPITTAEVHAEFGVQPGTLRQWKLRRKIKPARTEHTRNWWFPWDIFCILNPDIADAIATRDQIEAG